MIIKESILRKNYETKYDLNASQLQKVSEVSELPSIARVFKSVVNAENTAAKYFMPKDKIVNQLKNNPDTRQAAISIYDGKEIRDGNYLHDTPCTYAVQFTVVNGKLNMCVVMRSNDLWFGFCNDQYCFSKLQELVADTTGYKVGTYYHFAHNLHLYYDQLPERNPLTNRQREYA